MSDLIEDPSKDPPAGGVGRDRLLAAILALLVVYALAVAQALVVPVVVALLVSLMLAPVVRLLCRARLPRPLATAVVLLGLFGLLAGTVGSLVGPARAWIEDAPRSLSRIEAAVVALKQPLRAAAAAGERLTDLSDGGKSSTKPARYESEPNQLAQMLRAAPGVLSSVLVVAILIFVFLLHGENLLRKLVELAPALRLKREIVLATRSAQRELSVYMLTITVINTCLGALTALGLWLLGVPDPLLWGAIAGLLNYAPYLGPMLMLLVLSVVGFGYFDRPSDALLLPGLFLMLNIVEGQMLTPMVVGRRLALDPIIVFLGLVALGWLWGVAGVLLALPMLTCLRIVAEHVSGGETLATILRPSERQAFEPPRSAADPA